MNLDHTATLNKAWDSWKVQRIFGYHRFGQYFIDNYTKEYKNPDIFYETDNDHAYTELLWEIAGGMLDGKLVDNGNPIDYTSETNQKGGA
jgi:hypothetical protein